MPSRCFGGASLDLGAAEFEAPESVITVIALFGGAGTTAPSGVSIQLSGVALIGGKETSTRQSAASRLAAHSRPHVDC